jgi:hypothetical protein
LQSFRVASGLQSVSGGQTALGPPWPLNCGIAGRDGEI